MPTDPPPPPPPPADDAHVFCPFCGYDMRARFGDTCPECGQTVDEQAMRRAQVPWANRREIGTLRALFRTVWHVTFRTGTFAHAVSQTVSLQAALGFRRLVIVVLWLTCAVPAVTWLLTVDGPDVPEWMEVFEDTNPLWFGLAAAGLLWVLLYTWTGVHTYWFHPRHFSVERQNRAVALSYYACAPLLLLPIAAVLWLAGVILFDLGDAVDEPVFVIIGLLGLALPGGALAVLGIGGFWVATARLAGDAAERTGFGRLTLMLGQPAACVLLAGLILVALPAAGWYAWMMWTTWGTLG